jgi:Dullard-like phosphatase family protein
MDETMIHSPPPMHDRVIERPYIHEFLRDMHGAFDELVVFTAATREYASPILDRLESGKIGSLFTRRFYRDSCSVDVRTGMLVKDLRILKNPLDRTWILDNTPSAYALQPDRGIPISSFEGDLADRALVQIAPILKSKATAGI